MEGKHFCSLKFDWDYDSGYVDIKMPNYIFDALYHFQHALTLQPNYSSRTHNPIRYGEKFQYAKGTNLYKHLNQKQTKHVQWVIGKFLY